MCYILPPQRLGGSELSNNNSSPFFVTFSSLVSSPVCGRDSSPAFQIMPPVGKPEGLFIFSRFYFLSHNSEEYLKGFFNQLRQNHRV